MIIIILLVSIQRQKLYISFKKISHRPVFSNNRYYLYERVELRMASQGVVFHPLALLFTPGFIIEVKG